MSTPKIALITGAGTGVGRAAASALSADGWTILAVGRRLDPLTETVDQITQSGGTAHPSTTDVSDAAAVDTLFNWIESEFGRLDLLFNNAGASAPPVPIDQLSVEQWETVVGVNLTGSFLCARRAVALMKSQTPSGGRIINNGSVSSQVPRPHSAPYTATKHAITGLTKSLALDGRSHGITCGQIDIGNALTEMTAPMANGVPQADGSIKAEATMAAVDVGRAVQYMASLPADTNVLHMTVMAAEMPLVGRG